MRNKRLDVLRSIAVLLVLLHHSDIGTRLANGGWVGVDLFFVLSGFLISGLLFAEYKKRGSISFKRFFIRRGLKLYPEFYVCILVTLLYQLVGHHVVGNLSQYLSEMLYIQNYGPFIYRHTWSLAVEEHFYVLLPLFLLLLIRFSPHRGNPFQVMPWASPVVAATCLAFRIATVLNIPRADLRDWTVYRAAFATTHCRLDSLFFGVLLGYFHHFRPKLLGGLLGQTKNRIARKSAWCASSQVWWLLHAAPRVSNQRSGKRREFLFVPFLQALDLQSPAPAAGSSRLLSRKPGLSVTANWKSAEENSLS